MGTQKSPLCIGHVFCCYVDTDQSQESVPIRAVTGTNAIQWEVTRREKGRPFPMIDTQFNICSAEKCNKA